MASAFHMSSQGDFSNVYASRSPERRGTMPASVLKNSFFNRPKTPSQYGSQPKTVAIEQTMSSVVRGAFNAERSITIKHDEAKLTIMRKEVLKKFDLARKSHRKIADTLYKAILRREKAIAKNMHFLERIAKFAKRCDLSVGRSSTTQSCIAPSIPTACFQENLMQLTKNLYLIEVHNETEVDRLKFKVYNDFLEKLKDEPAQKTSINETFVYARQCVHKENKRKYYHEKASKADVEQSFISKVFVTPRGIKWDQAMTKAQFTESQRLTQEAIEHAVEEIRKASDVMKENVMELLKNYIHVEMLYHCRTVERLTEAYSFALKCCGKSPSSVKNNLDEVIDEMENVSNISGYTFPSVKSFLSGREANLCSESRSSSTIDLESIHHKFTKKIKSKKRAGLDGGVKETGTYENVSFPRTEPTTSRSGQVNDKREKIYRTYQKVAKQHYSFEDVNTYDSAKYDPSKKKKSSPNKPADEERNSKPEAKTTEAGKNTIDFEKELRTKSSEKLFIPKKQDSPNRNKIKADSENQKKKSKTSFKSRRNSVDVLDDESKIVNVPNSRTSFNPYRNSADSLANESKEVSTPDTHDLLKSSLEEMLEAEKITSSGTKTDSNVRLPSESKLVSQPDQERNSELNNKQNSLNQNDSSEFDFDFDEPTPPEP